MKPSICEEISRVIQARPTLRSIGLDLNVTSTHARPILKAIGALPNLHDLSLSPAVRDDGDAEAYSGDYPSLRKLRAQITSQTLNQLFSSITFPALMEHLDLNISADKNGRRGVLTHLEGFSHLKTLTLSLRSHPWMLDDLLAVLQCHQLVAFDVVAASCDLGLADQHILQMAQAWPMLWKFKFGSSTDPPLVTFFGLESFAKHCPLLQELAIHVDAGGVSDVAVTHAAPKMKRLDLGGRLPDGRDDVIVRRIVSMWPTHQELYAWSDESAYYVHWSSIKKEVGRMRVSLGLVE